MEELVVELTTQLLVVTVAIWILVAAVYASFAKLEEYIKKELMVIIIAIIVTLVGWATGFFTGHLIALVATSIVAVSVSQELYDKIKYVIGQYQK